MKAVLEFNYPEDEDKLRHALNGTDYYKALLEIDKLLNESTNKLPKLKDIRDVVNKAMEGLICGM
jgi:vacuolar-type H+-ATPase subunit C/Vma6